MKAVFRWLLAIGMVSMGVLHILLPANFAEVVPHYLPNHPALVMISGVFEILGGVGLLIPRVRVAAGWGLILLYVAVFPVNIDMALHPGPNASVLKLSILWLRLPFQPLFMLWARWVSTSQVGDSDRVVA